VHTPVGDRVDPVLVEAQGATVSLDIALVRRGAVDRVVGRGHARQVICGRQGNGPSRRPAGRSVRYRCGGGAVDVDAADRGASAVARQVADTHRPGTEIITLFSDDAIGWLRGRIDIRQLVSGGP